MASFIPPDTGPPRWLLPVVGSLLAGAAGLALGYTIGARPVRPPGHLPGYVYVGPMPVIPLVTPIIGVEDGARVTKQLTELRDVEHVILMIHTMGGILPPVVQIARAIQRHGGVRVFVPFHALSGGTLIGLAASELWMWPHATLGPVDPQIGPYSASSLLAVLESKPAESIDDKTLALAHEAKKALEQTLKLTREFVGDRPELLRRLVAGETTHSYPITVEEAKLIGLDVAVAVVDQPLGAAVRALIPPEEFESWEPPVIRR